MLGCVIYRETTDHVFTMGIIHGHASLLKKIIFCVIAMVLVKDTKGKIFLTPPPHIFIDIERDLMVYALGQNSLVHLNYDLGIFMRYHLHNLTTSTLLHVWTFENFTFMRPPNFLADILAKTPIVFLYILGYAW